MRPRWTAWLCALLTAGWCFAPPAFGTDVDGPDDCQRIAHDFGDAPEDFPAYPGVLGRFPTCTMPTAPGTQEVASGCPPISSPPGPTGFVIHRNLPGGYWLGCTPPLPMGIDTDPNGKTSPGLGQSFCDGSPVDCFEAAFGLGFGQDECFGGNDAGVSPPIFKTCAMSTITYTTYNCGPSRTAFLNVLIDMNQDGDWNDSFLCPSGVCAYEWAVMNLPVQIAPGCNTQASPPVLVGPNAGHAWMRVSISDPPVNPDFPWAGTANLLDPLEGGETEDYPIEIEPSQPDPCDLGYEDFGDAPEELPAYASGVAGHFPTCVFASAPGTQEIQCGAPLSTPPGPTGFIRHRAVAGDPAHFWLGCPVPGGSFFVDAEHDGKMNVNAMPPAVSHCDPSVIPDCSEAAFGMSFAQDECTADGVDAGIASPIQFVACSTGVVSFTAFSCTPVEVYLNVLVDWNEDGDWNDNLACATPYPTGCAYEWAVKNVPIALAPGCQTIASPPFLAGPHAGQGWLRITLTQEPVCDDYPWNGSACVPGEEYKNGETEDYPVTIRKPVLDPCDLGYEDWGDAPEELTAYPNGTPGRFPTCLFAGMPGSQQIQCGAVVAPPPGPTGYVRHVSLSGDPWKVWLGCGAAAIPGGIDAERDGKVNLGLPFGGPSFCDQTVATDCIDVAFGLMRFNQDECWGDLVDAGVVNPRSFGACSTGSVVFQAMNCSTIEDIAFVNVLVDWNEDGDWLDNLSCPGGPSNCAYEWAVQNAVIRLIPGCGSYATPVFRVGPNLGPGWMRMTLTREPVPPDFPWNGSVSMPGGEFRGGETEDYPVEILASPVGVAEPPTPADLRLAVRPNPSRQGVSIELALPRESDVALGVYDIAGRELSQLARGPHRAGTHTLRWDYRGRDGSIVPAGLYLVKLRVGDRVITKTMVRIP